MYTMWGACVPAFAFVNACLGLGDKEQAFAFALVAVTDGGSDKSKEHCSSKTYW
jgi:hypothetical protein